MSSSSTTVCPVAPGPRPSGWVLGVAAVAGLLGLAVAAGGWWWMRDGMRTGNDPEADPATRLAAARRVAQGVGCLQGGAACAAVALVVCLLVALTPVGPEAPGDGPPPPLRWLELADHDSLDRSGWQRSAHEAIARRLAVAPVAERPKVLRALSPPELLPEVQNFQGEPAPGHDAGEVTALVGRVLRRWQTLNGAAGDVPGAS